MAVLDPSVLISIVSLLVLLVCSALISGTEVALFSLSKTDLDVEEDHPSHRKIKILNHLLKEPQKLLATILIVNNLVNIAIVLVFASISSILYQGLNLVRSEERRVGKECRCW